MPYAKVVVGLPVEGPFDYSLLPEQARQAAPGCRLLVPFGPRKLVGYIVGITKNTTVAKVKPALKLIDSAPLLDRRMLLLARRLSQYYCCGWGEVIEAALPLALRRGVKVPPAQQAPLSQKKTDRQVLLVRAFDEHSKWAKYLEYIREALARGSCALVLLKDESSLLRAREYISSELAVTPLLLLRGGRQELKSWLAARESKAAVILGMRSAVFAPASGLGLIIVDEEQDPAYKQEQSPHYHARQAALARAEIVGADLVLGSISPSLESFYLAKKNRIKYLSLPAGGPAPEIKFVNTGFTGNPAGKDRPLFSKYLQDCIYSALNDKKRILVFLNRRGFAAHAACHNCGFSLKCPRCDLGLVYDMSGDILVCRHCNFRMPPPKICPNCSAGYIKYSGAGTQKLESVISRMFPRARLIRLDGSAVSADKQADIYVATSGVFKEADKAFDLTGVLMIDNALNRIDLRSGEKVMGLLLNLLRLTKEKLLIETNFPGHHAFKALTLGQIDVFYEEELKQRAQSGFSPSRHLVALRVRGKDQGKAQQAARELFESMEGAASKGIRMISLGPGMPAKLRDNFYWQILLSCASPRSAGVFLKTHLKNFRRSGIIVTVDVDPV